MIGMGTKFLEQVEIGSSLKVPGQQTTPAVAKIISDTELEIKFAFEDSVENASFKIWPKLDHSQVYSRVWKRLAQGGSIGIFPEGGSHDNPHLLPLKAGVTVMVTFWMASFFSSSYSSPLIPSHPPHRLLAPWIRIHLWW